MEKDILDKIPLSVKPPDTVIDNPGNPVQRTRDPFGKNSSKAGIKSMKVKSSPRENRFAGGNNLPVRTGVKKIIERRREKKQQGSNG
jgi:hypothetical protein